jgi:hypothetical protein
MRRMQKTLWFSALYVASVVAFALLTLTLRALLQLAQSLVQT